MTTEPRGGRERGGQFILTRQQRAVHDVLGVRGDGYGQTYLGAVMVLGHAGNPDRYALAAHGLREVAEMLQRDFGVAVRIAGESMRAKANELDDAYARAEDSVKQAIESNPPATVDRRLRLLLRRLVEFVEWNREFAPRRRVRATRAVRIMAVPGALPSSQHAETHVDELIRCHERLNGLAHHRPTSETEITAEVDRFEKLLLALLGGPSMQLRELDELMKGGDSHAD
jgi:hypothetical protein